MAIRYIDIKQEVLSANDGLANKLRVRLKEHKTLMINVMSSPGAGKTTLLLDTIQRLREQLRIGVVEDVYKRQPIPCTAPPYPEVNGRIHPFSHPAFTGKLVQEAMQMILGAVYEPAFSNSSHRFQLGGSCHKARGWFKDEFIGTS